MDISDLQEWQPSEVQTAEVGALGAVNPSLPAKGFRGAVGSQRGTDQRSDAQAFPSILNV